jgi:hypothetical protein
VMATPRMSISTCRASGAWKGFSHTHLFVAFSKVSMQIQLQPLPLAVLVRTSSVGRRGSCARHACESVALPPLPSPLSADAGCSMPPKQYAKVCPHQHLL